jgi:hypothetical protein
MATFVKYVHCSRCGKRCSGVDPELGLVVRAWVECPECLETLSAEAAARGNLPQRLHAAIQRVIRETRGFNERKQEAWCTVCRNRDQHRLHNPECSIYELHGAWEEALAAAKVKG